MKQKKYIILIVIIILIIIFLLFNYKNSNSVNTIISTRDTDIKEYILNMQSYKATVTIEVHSNKNSNQYVLKQEYETPNKNIQEVVQPSYLKGLKITYDGTNFKIENTIYNISQIYDKYSHITNNSMFLNDFIEQYKNNPESQYTETEKEAIFETKPKDNQYRYQKILYVDKNTKKPTKMEIKNITQNTVVYILYNEIEINNI